MPRRAKDEFHLSHAIDPEGLDSQMGEAAALSIALFFLIRAWYSLLRFRGKERRKRAGSVRKADIARQFGVQADQIDRWQGAKRLTVYHNEKGRIDRVEM